MICNNCHEYDAENRLTQKGDIVFTNDKDGNTLNEKGLRYEARYEYNGQNRMTFSQVINHTDKTHNLSYYAYDALGRRTITQNAEGHSLRSIYDGGSFELIREGETFRDGSLTTRYANTSTAVGNYGTVFGRYRWIGDEKTTDAEDGYTASSKRYGIRGVMLYGRGEAVAVSYSSNAGGRMWVRV